MCLSEQVTAYVCVCLHMSPNGRPVGLGSIRSVIHGRDWPKGVETIMSDVGRRRMLSDVGRWKMNPVRSPGIQARQGTLDRAEGFGLSAGCSGGPAVGSREFGAVRCALCIVRYVFVGADQSTMVTNASG